MTTLPRLVGAAEAGEKVRLARTGRPKVVGTRSRATEIAIKRALSTIRADFSLGQPERVIGEAGLHIFICRRLGITPGCRQSCAAQLRLARNIPS